jgi:hypothetical protein
MKHAGPTRKEIGVRTAFNLLGPMTNPAGARRQVVGVGAASAAPKLAEVLRLLGAERALVVHGDGMDELPLDGTGVLYDVTPAGVVRRQVVAAELGLTPAPMSALVGGDPAHNAAARGSGSGRRARTAPRRGPAQRRRRFRGGGRAAGLRRRHIAGRRTIGGAARPLCCNGSAPRRRPRRGRLARRRHGPARRHAA